MTNVRESQKVIIRNLLQFNANQLKKSSKNTFSEWKVFIYDKSGQDVISPLWTIKELREQGVTLHMNLFSNREPIPEAPAVYFVMPTEQVVNKICEDFKSNLYKCYYINFLTHSSRALLERLADSAVECGISHLIRKVYDQYSNFISLEDNFFILTQRDERMSFYALNRINAEGSEVDRIVEAMTDGLFSLLITLGLVPLIRCSRGGYAEALARSIDSKLRNCLSDIKNNYFTGSAIGQLSLRRPLLILLDRTFDIATMLCHSWTYQSLLHDVMDMRLNRLKMADQKTTYDLENNDSFWHSHRGSVFPCVAEDIQQELDHYRTSEDEIKRLKAAFGMCESENDKVVSMISTSTAKLTSAVGSLPQLLEKKRILDMHTNIATVLLTIIKERKLDNFFGTEEKIMTGTLSDKAFDDIITSNIGTTEDRIRLLLIYYIFSKRVNINIEKYIESVGPDMNTIIKFVRRWKSLTTALIDVRDTGSAATSTSMFSDLLSKASRFAMEGVKNFVVSKKKMPITRIVENLMQNKRNPETDAFACFDPQRANQYGAEPQQKTAFNEAIVFVVGGGNYMEYTNLEEYRKEISLTDCNIIYGSTELINPESFLSQLKHLGNEIS
ncbi:hypothetical protein GJ496_007744 [Pomphorhynchus laevis]|nr:hypothetical protein GJ496_007744 [Pomphorhynchus laevis]